MMPTPARKIGLFSAGLIVTALFAQSDVRAADNPPAEQKPPESSSSRPRKIFAHYMGCFPLGYGAMPDAQMRSARSVRHDAKDLEDRMGGRFKTWPLLPANTTLTPSEGADLEIRRALRAGLDGFAIDAWAGDVGARATLDALFEAAEAGKYPFEITICLDPACLPPGEDGYLAAIRYLLEKHGDSPNLARRDGKPLIFGYSSEGLVRPQLPLDSEEKWSMAVQAYKDLEAKVGQPIFFHIGMEFFLNGVDFGRLGMSREEALVKAAEKLGQNFGAVGLFLDYDMEAHLKKLSAAVRAGGAEWAPPMTIQYDNFLGNLHGPKGTAYLRDGWERARRDDATLIQFATWNDYGEHTSLAPTMATGYGVGELNRYFAQWWRTGTPPATDHDQIYATYRKYPSGTKIFPFQSYRGSPGILEILTILPQPATVRLPGRLAQEQPIEFEAPAGLSVKQFPLTPGPVKVEVVREGKTVTTLEAPEPVTDRPYGEDNTLVCASTEDQRAWQEDFPGQPYPHVSAYGDSDGDGLPNWFEMYWFGKMGDSSTETEADPAADPDGDGRTNLEEYLARTDPTQKPAVYPPDFVWDLTDVYRSDASFNPDHDSLGSPVWFYLGRLNKTEDRAFVPMTDGWMRNLYHSGPNGVIGWKEYGAPDDPAHPQLKLRARSAGEVAVAWQSPVDGVVDVEWETAPVKTSDGMTFSVWNSSGGETFWSRVLKNGDQISEELKGVKVRAGDRILFIQDSLPGTDGAEFFAFDKLRILLRKSGR